jgi:RNA polymerase sigma-70 factor, ECF subfamily
VGDDLDGLARRAADGDAVALAAFVRATQGEVWRLCAALVDPGVADDVAQDAYLRAIRAFPAFRGDSSARTWLLAIARRACADELRRRAGRTRLLQRTGRREPVPDHAGATELVTLIRALPPQQRDAFVVTQLVGLSYEEAAAVCGCAIGTIRSRVARARAALVAAMDEPAGRRATSAPAG